jgi:hypothetical protein
LRSPRAARQWLEAQEPVFDAQFPTAP